jgi:hypothetical protein
MSVCWGYREEEGVWPYSADQESFKVSKMWEESYAMNYVGGFKTGRPNKQQKVQLDRHRAEWNRDRCMQLRDRREKRSGWIGNAVVEIEDDRKELEEMGLEGYFEKSLVRMKELKTGAGGEVSA